MSPFPTRLSALLVSTLLVVGAQLAMATPASAKLWKVPAPDPSLDPLIALTEYETRVVRSVNKERRAADLKPVRYFSGCLDRASERWAAHLVDIGELKHRNLDKLLTKCDLDWVGETLVRGTNLLPGDAVEAWMDSPSHREVLMKPRARLAGVGTKLDAEGRLVTVLNFSDPD